MHIQILLIIWIFMLLAEGNSLLISTARPVPKKRQNNRNSQVQIRNNPKNNIYQRTYYPQATYSQNQQASNIKNKNKNIQYQQVPRSQNIQSYATQYSYNYPSNQNHLLNSQNPNKVKQQYVSIPKQAFLIINNSLQHSLNQAVNKKIDTSSYQYNQQFNTKPLNLKSFSKFNNFQKFSSHLKVNRQLQQEIDMLIDQRKQQTESNVPTSNSRIQNLIQNGESNPKRAHNNSVKGKFNSVMGIGNNVIGNYNNIRPVVQGPNEKE